MISRWGFEMVDEALQEQWRERLDSFTKSGKSIRVWCLEQEIPEHRFHYWRRRLTAKPQSGGWLAMAVVAEPVVGGVAIRVGRALIEVQPGFDAALLQSVVRALESAPC